MGVISPLEGKELPNALWRGLEIYQELPRLAILTLRFGSRQV